MTDIDIATRGVAVVAGVVLLALCLIWLIIMGQRLLIRWKQPVCDREGCNEPGRTWYDPTTGQMHNLCTTCSLMHIGVLRQFTTMEERAKTMENS